MDRRNRYLFKIDSVSLAKQRITRTSNFFVDTNIREGTVEFHQEGVGNLIEFKISLLDIQEIRDWEKCSQSMMYLSNQIKWNDTMFALLYGKEFLFKCILFTNINSKGCSELMQNLQKALGEYKYECYKLKLERFLFREYFMYKDQFKNCNLDDLCKILRNWCSLNNYLFRNNREIKSFLENENIFDINTSREFTFENFNEFFFKIILNRQDNVIKNLFLNYSSRSDNDTDNVFTSENLENFIKMENKVYSKFEIEDNAAEILRKYSSLPMKTHLTSKEFSIYLFSEDNSIVNNLFVNNICHDMNRPLCDYWISSSHNTYLTGNQINSDASVECYVRALKMGCRCVEIDCWDPVDKNSLPLVKHGGVNGITFAGVISFEQVLRAINVYAFEASCYPIILSIEDHCCPKVQEKMAKCFRDVFGEKLVTSFLSPFERTLPSPEQLKYKIIIKHKKNKNSSSSSKESDRDSTSEDSLSSLGSEATVDRKRHKN